MRAIVFKMFRFGVLMALLSLLGACALPQDFARRSSGFAATAKIGDSPRINAFLALKDSRAPAVRMEIGKLEISADDLWLPLMRAAVTLDSAQIDEGQIFLDGVQVPPGLYQKLRITVTQAWARNLSGEWDTLLSEPLVQVISLAQGLGLDPHDSRSLFFVWDVEESLARLDGYSPMVSASPALRQIPRDLIYVSCPDIDTVFVIRGDNRRVVDSFGLKGRPTWVEIDRAEAGERLYVLTPADRMVKAVDLSSYRIVNFFQVPLNDTPTFMTIDPAGNNAYLLDERSGYLSRMDLRSGSIMARALVGFRPQYAKFIEERNLLAVSLEASQRVLLLDPMSLAVRGSLSTGASPQGIMVSANRLYVAEQGDNTVSVFDLGSQTSQERIAVGYDPVRLLDSGNHIYVSQEQEGTLAVLLPGQMGVIQEIHGMGRPREMAYHPFFRHIYVTDRERGGLSVVDVNSNMLVLRISLGAVPFALAVSQ